METMREVFNEMGVRHLNTQQIEHERTHLLESPMRFLERETGVDFLDN